MTNKELIDHLKSIIESLIDDEPCWKDHHGYCQAHYLSDPCEIDEARKALSMQPNEQEDKEMTDMIERVARALANVHDDADMIIEIGDGNKVPLWQCHIPDAIAAIKAMRDPTDEMVAAGDEKMATFNIYRTMIDEALGENT